jgi:hypothetical protein
VATVGGCIAGHRRLPCWPARRLFTQDSKIYDSSLWRSYNGLEPQDPQTQRLSPDWDSPIGASYSFYALDGGAINNEPLELVRRYLARNSDDGCNPRPRIRPTPPS